MQQVAAATRRHARSTRQEIRRNLVRPVVLHCVVYLSDGTVRTDEAQVDPTVPRTLIAYRSLQLTPFLLLVVDLERYSYKEGVAGYLVVIPLITLVQSTMPMSFSNVANLTRSNAFVKPSAAWSLVPIQSTLIAPLLTCCWI